MCDKERATSSGRYGREEWQTRAANRKRRGGKHGLSSYVGQRVCLRGSGGKGAKPLLALRTWKKKKAKPFTSRHYELTASKEANLISHKRHSDVRSERSTGDCDDDGCC